MLLWWPEDWCSKWNCIMFLQRFCRRLVGILIYKHDDLFFTAWYHEVIKALKMIVNNANVAYLTVSQKTSCVNGLLTFWLNVNLCPLMQDTVHKWNIHKPNRTWTSGSTWLGGRHETGMFGIKSSVWQRSTVEFANKEEDTKLTVLCLVNDTVNHIILWKNEHPPYMKTILKYFIKETSIYKHCHYIQQKSIMLV